MARAGVARRPGGAEWIAPHIPGFDILGELGRGGMGVVYRARHHLLNRPCALKMILAGAHASPEASIRFLAEAEAVARARHPNIIQIYEIGSHDGHAYLELEFAEGGSLDGQLDGIPWGPKHAARLIEPLARAVAEAHRLGIVHRDLKPANILLMADGTPKIGDFGLVKVVESGAGLTQTDSILGSPTYMAPEQADRRHADVGPGADIYSLGAILFEMLTGRPPFRGATVFQTLEQVKAAEPIRPSRLVPGLPRDIETIVLKCLDKSPALRYAAASDLADDLDRFTSGKPVQARPLPFWGRGLRWAHRRPTTAAAMAAIALLLAALLGLGAWSYVEIGRALTAAQAGQAKALEASEESRRMAGREAATRTASDRVSADLSLGRGLDLAASGQPGRGLLWMAEARRIVANDPASAPLRRVAQLNFAAWRDRMMIPRAVFSHPDGITMMALDPAGHVLATASQDGTVRLWEADSGRPIGSALVCGAQVASVAFVQDGATLVAAGDRFVTLWDAATGQPRVPPIPLAGKAFAWAPSHGDSFVLGMNNQVQFRSTSTGELLAPPTDLGRPMADCGFSKDGRLAVIGGDDMAAHLFDATRGTPTGPALRHGDAVIGVTVAPDGRRFATVTGGSYGAKLGTLRVFEVGREEPLFATTASPVGCYDVGFRPDGRAVLTLGLDGLARLWDADNGNPVGAVMPHSEALNSAFSPDGLVVAIADRRGEVRLWDAHDGRALGSVIGHSAQCRNCLMAPDGRTLYSSSIDGTARAYDITPLAAAGAAAAEIAGLDDAEFSPDGRLLATAGKDGTARLLDAATGHPVGPPLLVGGRVRSVRFSPDGRTLAAGGDDGVIRLWNVATGAQLGQPLPMGHWILNLKFSPDGRTLLAGRVEGVGRLWDVARGQAIGPPLNHPGRAPGEDIWNVAYSPDSRVAMTGSTDGTVGFWDTASGQRLGNFHHFGGTIERIIAHPDGRRVFVAVSGRIHCLDLATQTEPKAPVRINTFDMALSPDGRTLLVGGRDRTARRIDAETGRPVGPPMDQGADIMAVAYSPDGQSLLIATVAGEARLWDAATGRPIGPRLARGFVPGGNPPERRAGDRQTLAMHPAGHLAVSCSGTLAWWPIPSATAGDDATLAASARVLSGQEFDDAGNLRPLAAEEWARQLARVRPTGSAEADAASWHDRWSALAERRGQVGAALWHLDRLVEAEPDAWSSWTHRARVRRRLGDLTGAAADEAVAAALAPGPPLAAWEAHEAFGRATTAERDQRWGEARVSLARLAAATPRDGRVWVRLAHANAQLGRWGEAAAALAAAARGGPERVAVPVQQGLALLSAGDIAAYRSACAGWRQEALSAPLGVPADLWCAALILGPGGLDDYGPLLARTEAASTGSGHPRPLDPNLVGALLVRAGRDAQGIEVLEGAIRQHGGAGTVWSQAFLALAHGRLGHREAARRWLDQLTGSPPDTAPGSFWDNVLRDVLRREAEALIRFDPVFPPDPFAPGLPTR